MWLDSFNFFGFALGSLNFSLLFKILISFVYVFKNVKYLWMDPPIPWVFKLTPIQNIYWPTLFTLREANSGVTVWF